MRQLSNADYDLIIRLLNHLSGMKVSGRTDCEARRKATLLARKLKKRDDGRVD